MTGCRLCDGVYESSDQGTFLRDALAAHGEETRPEEKSLELFYRLKRIHQSAPSQSAPNAT